MRSSTSAEALGSHAHLSNGGLETGLPQVRDGSGYRDLIAKDNGLYRGVYRSAMRLRLLLAMTKMWSRSAMQKLPYSVRYVAQRSSPIVWSCLRKLFKVLRLVIAFLLGITFSYHFIIFILGRSWVPIGNKDYLEEWMYVYTPVTPMLTPTDNTVTVDIYDLGYIWVHINDLLMKFQMGAFHTEINVYDLTFRYSGIPVPYDAEGFARKDLESNDGMPYRGRLTLGTTDLTREQIQEKWEKVSAMENFNYGNHEVLGNNCNDMAAYMADQMGFLHVWPFWVDEFPKKLGHYMQPYWTSMLAIEEIAKKPKNFKKVLKGWWNDDLWAKYRYKDHPFHFSDDSYQSQWAWWDLKK
eukprot:GHVH01015611.1.p1 GENE.GHVH01015611.1~~GHVH01015611.1.p1  ORF type:complete len:353 (-),score=31.44 GHVH01015611.1:1084-2142(-)